MKAKVNSQVLDKNFAMLLPKGTQIASAEVTITKTRPRETAEAMARSHAELFWENEFGKVDWSNVRVCIAHLANSVSVELMGGPI